MRGNQGGCAIAATASDSVRLRYLRVHRSTPSPIARAIVINPQSNLDPTDAVASGTIRGTEEVTLRHRLIAAS